MLFDLQVFGGAKLLGRPVRQLSDLEKIVLEGMPFSAVENAFRVVSPGQSKDELHVMLHVVFHADDGKRYGDLQKALSKISAKKGIASSLRLETAEGERAERLARIYALALKAVGSKKAAGAFMFAPHKMLAGSTPLEKLETEVGAHEVERILAASIYGLPA